MANNIVNVINRSNGVKLKALSLEDGEYEFSLGLYMDRYLLSLSHFKEYLYSYDLNNLEKIEQTKDQYEIFNDYQLNLVRCSGNKIFFIDPSEVSFFV